MKTTIDLPDDLLLQAKIIAAERRTTIKALVVSGLNHVLKGEPATNEKGAALARLRKGIVLRGKPLSREQLHARK